jgi:PAS domain S-box-containing protein
MHKSVIFIRVVAVLVGVNSVSVLTGWAIGNYTLVRLLPSLSPMVPNTAFCFFLIGLWYVLTTLQQSRLIKITRTLSTALVLLIGIISVLEYILWVDLGIDQMLFDDVLSGEFLAGRMSLLAAICFTLTAGTALSDTLGWDPKKVVSQYTILITFFLSLFSITGTFFGAIHLYSYITAMAIHTALSFMLLTTAYLALHYKTGWASLFIADNLAGILLRNILIPLVVLYPILAFLRLQGEQAGFYNSEGGTTFMVVSSLAVFTIIVIFAAQTINKLDREKDQYKKFFEMSSEMLVIAGTDGYIKLTSGAFTKILGYSPEEVSATRFFTFIHPDDHPIANQALEKLGQGLSVSAFQLRLKSKTGIVKHFIWSVTPDKKTGDLFAAGYDITEIKEAEQVRALAEKLSIQNKQLASFAHIVSHNLRAPVGNMTALLELHKLAVPEERDSLFDKFQRVADHLSNTLNDLVESLRIKEDITKEREPLHFDDVLHKTKEILTGQILEAGATITHNFNRQPTIVYPRIYLESIFLNLLSNALKYRSAQRPLKVHFETLEVNKNLVLSVEDNGQGIDMARNKEKLFGFYKAFHQGKDSKGMGLFLTKTQIEAMGGTISVQSAVNQGTTFTIVLGKVSGS